MRTVRLGLLALFANYTHHLTCSLCFYVLMYMFLTTDYYGRSFRVHKYVLTLYLAIIMKNCIIVSINRIQEKRIVNTSLTIT